MLDFFRQYKQHTGLFMLTALLFVWLSFSCQNCFADTVDEAAQKMHAAMDCCPSDSHSGHDKADGEGCDVNYLVKQPILSEQAQLQLVDYTDVLLPTAELRFESVYPTLVQPTALNPDAEVFSERLFSSYRILLI